MEVAFRRVGDAGSWRPFGEEDEVDRATGRRAAAARDGSGVGVERRGRIGLGRDHGFIPPISIWIGEEEANVGGEWGDGRASAGGDGDEARSSRSRSRRVREGDRRGAVESGIGLGFTGVGYRPGELGRLAGIGRWATAQLGGGGFCFQQSSLFCFYPFICLLFCFKSF